MYKKWAEALKKTVIESHNKNKILSKMKESILGRIKEKETAENEIEQLFASLSGD